MAKNTQSEIPPVSNISIEISFFYTGQIANLISFLNNYMEGSGSATIK